MSRSWKPDVAAAVATAAGETPLRLRPLGDLAMPSGTVLVCDPASPGHHAAARLEPGSHAFALALAELPGPDERVAYALLGDHAAAARWEPLRTPFPVDSGFACMMDGEAAESLGMGGAALRELLEQGNANRVPTWTWAELTLAAPRPDLIAFSAGFGDGTYRAFLGLDADGRAVAAAADFGVVIGRGG